MATTVGVRELKNSLSRYLRLVRAGERIVVLDRGRPVAIVMSVPEGAEGRSTEEHLASLAARGLLVLGRAHKRRRPGRLPRADLSGAVDEDREETT